MKKLLITLLACVALQAAAEDYYRITKFPIDNATISDKFLIVVHYANNTYIWNGQEASGKNYVCLQNMTEDHISGDYQDNEVTVVHNQYHAYKELFSVMCKGDGDRDDKGGYYLGGVANGNGISFQSGQLNAEISFVYDAAQACNVIKIATKSGNGIFRYNITPNDPHGFKFYQYDTNMLYPMLYVKGVNTRYMDASGIEDVTRQPAAAATKKVLRNGQLLILRNGQAYNASGISVE